MWCFRYVPKTGVNSQLKLHRPVGDINYTFQKKMKWDSRDGGGCEWTRPVDSLGKVPTYWPLGISACRAFCQTSSQRLQTVPSAAGPNHALFSSHTPYLSLHPAFSFCLSVSLSLPVFLFQCRHVFPKARISKSLWDVCLTVLFFPLTPKFMHFKNKSF